MTVRHMRTLGTPWSSHPGLTPRLLYRAIRDVVNNVGYKDEIDRGIE